MVRHFRSAGAVALAILSVHALAQQASQAQQQPAATTSQPPANGAPPPGQQIPNLPKLPSINQEAFRAVTEEGAPLTPDQIRTLRRMLDDAERAAAAPPRFNPEPVSTAVSAVLTPGATPPVIRTAMNYVTTALFIDSVGNPLNVIDVTPGGAAGFTITPNPVPRNINKIEISPKSTYAAGNVSVWLEGVKTPVSLTLISGQRQVDYRVDVRVKGRFQTAANAASPSTSSSPEGANPVLQTFLEGIPPDGARPLTTSNAEVQAWAFRNRFYVRAPFAVVSPAWIDTQRSADGTAVYEIPPTPVIVTMVGGVTGEVNLSGY